MFVQVQAERRQVVEFIQGRSFAKQVQLRETEPRGYWQQNVYNDVCELKTIQKAIFGM